MWTVNKFWKNSEKSSIYRHFSQKLDDNFAEILRKFLWILKSWSSYTLHFPKNIRKMSRKHSLNYKLWKFSWRPWRIFEKIVRYSETILEKYFKFSNVRQTLPASPLFPQSRWLSPSQKVSLFLSARCKWLPIYLIAAVCPALINLFSVDASRYNLKAFPLRNARISIFFDSDAYVGFVNWLSIYEKRSLLKKAVDWKAELTP